MNCYHLAAKKGLMSMFFLVREPQVILFSRVSKGPLELRFQVFILGFMSKGVSEYTLSKSIPTDLMDSLPTVEEIEAELNELEKEDY